MHAMLFIYDADCGFCTAAVKRFRKLFPKVEFTASREVNLSDFGLTQEDADQRVYLIVPSAHSFTTYGGGRAVTGLLSSWGRGGKVAAKLLSFFPFRVPIEGIYRLVARNRHALPGGDTTCGVVPQAQK